MPSKRNASDSEAIVGLSLHRVQSPVVHTARRYYRLNGSVRPWDWPREVGNYYSGLETSTNLVI